MVRCGAFSELKQNDPALVSLKKAKVCVETNSPSLALLPQAVSFNRFYQYTYTPCHSSIIKATVKAVANHIYFQHKHHNVMSQVFKLLH